MITENFSNSRANLKALMDRAVSDKAPIKITRQKAEGVVIISESEWAGIEETIHLLSSPNNAKILLESVAQLDAGDGQTHDLIEK